MKKIFSISLVVSFLAPSIVLSQDGNNSIIDKPSVNPGDNPVYNPSENPNSQLSIPSSDDKPNVSPTEDSPSDPNLGKVPFGKPGNVHYHDSTKITSSGSSTSTTKLDLLENHSDLDAEKVLNLGNDELAELDKILSSAGNGSDKAKKAVEIADRIKNDKGFKEGDSAKVLRLITDFGADVDRIQGFTSSRVLFIADLSSVDGLDTNKVLNFNDTELDVLEKFNTLSGGDKNKAKKAINLNDRIKNFAGAKEGDGEKVLRLVADVGLDVDKLDSYSESRVLLIANLGTDDRKAQKAFQISERFTSKTTTIAGQNLADVALGLCANEEIGLGVETLEILTSVDQSSESILVGLNNVFNKTGREKAKVQQRKSSFFKITESSQSNFLLSKLSSAQSSNESGEVVNPVEQLFLLDEKVIERIAAVDTAPEILAGKAIESLKTSSFAASLNLEMDPSNLDVHDINSIFNNYDRLESTGLAGDEEFENVREQIASIIVLDVVSDNFKVEIVNSDGTETPVQAAVQFSDVAGAYGESVLLEIEGLSSSAEIVEEMNELNPSLFIAHVQENDDFDHHSEITNMLGADASSDAAQRLRRSSHDTKEVSALTKIKEFQRDTIIDEVLSTYAGVIPVGKEAMQVILSPGSEKEEHHHEEAMNSASHAHFAQYIDDIVPDELSAVGETGQASFSNQLSNLRTRLSNIRLAQMGLPSGGNILDGIIAQSLDELQDEDLWEAQTNGSILEKYLSKAIDQEAIDARNGFFAQASASFHEDSYQQMDGDSYGLTFGVDQQLSDSFTFGIMGGIGKADSSGSGIEVDTDSLFAGIYGNWLSGDTFIDGYFSIGFHDTETSRKENSGAVLSSSPNSNQYTASLTFGKVLEYESFLITPSAGFTYDQFRTGEYTEAVTTQSTNGVPASSSQMFENNDYSLLSSLGLKVAHFHYQPEGNVLIPELRASWEHDFDDDPTSQKVRMLSHSEPYTIDGRSEDTDYGFVGTGITSLNKNGRTLYLHYDYLFGKSDYDAHFINLGFRIIF